MVESSASVLLRSCIITEKIYRSPSKATCVGVCPSSASLQHAAVNFKQCHTGLLGGIRANKIAAGPLLDLGQGSNRLHVMELHNLNTNKGNCVPLQLQKKKRFSKNVN